MNENENLWAIYLGGERGLQRITNHERANNLLIEDDQLTSSVPAIAYQSLDQAQEKRIAEHQSILEEDEMARDERGKKGKLAESVNAKLLRLSSEGAGTYKIPKRRRSRSSSRGRRSRSRSRGRKNRSRSRSSSSRSRSRGRRSRTRSRSRRRRTRSRSPDSSTARIKKKFQEDRPNRRWTKKYDLPLPKTILDLCEEEECRICGIVITSMLVCEQHYDGAKHNRKIAVELEKFHQENPKEPMPKRVKTGGGGPTPTITGQAESFLAELAGAMELPLTPRQQEQRELYDPPLAPEVLALIKEDECGICDKLQLSSEVVAHGHYHGRKHEKRLLKLLADKGVKVPKKKGCIVAENSAWQQGLMSPLRCELCQVDFTGPSCASLHYAGAKHQKRLNQANRMAEFNIEVEQEEEAQPAPAVEDRTFGIGTAFNQLSEADKERMEEVGKIEAMLAQAKSEAVVAQGRQPAAALWGGLTEQDIDLYNQSPFFCTVCDLDCQNQGALDAHYKGKPHAKKVKAKENEGPGLFCDICQISCLGADQMRMHLVSKKHQKKSRGNGVARDLGLFSCEICGVGCSDQCALDAHMSGQKHARVALKLARANTDFYAKD